MSKLVQTGGTLDITTGGVISSLHGYLGYESGSYGTATVDGSGSTWSLQADLSVGNYGTGILNITDGGVVSSSEVNLGKFTNAHGTATVDGAASTWTIQNDLFVGNYGTGILNITDGGVVSSSEVNLGKFTNAHGTATVDGAASTWTIQNDLFVGNYGTGILTVSNGATVDVTGDTHVAFQDGAAGEIHFDNGTLNTTFLRADISQLTGTGTINAVNMPSGAGDVDMFFDAASGTHTTVTLNSLPDQDITMHLNLSPQENLYIGYSDIGTLTIRDGGAITCENAYLGYESGSNGTASVDGIGSTWDMGIKYLFVGYSGTGALNITGGGTVSGYGGSLGEYSDSAGTATVDGDGSTWNLAGGTLQIGCSGNGTLNITGGGNVHSSSGYLGGSDDSNDTVTVGGSGSLWTMERGLNVRSSGALSILDGGTVSSDSGYIYGTVTVDGAGSTLSMSSELYVVRDGMFEVTGGGTVSSIIGRVAGTATVNGPDSKWNISDDLQVGYGATGVLNITGGNTVEVGGVSSTTGYVNSTSLEGEIHFDNGTLITGELKTQISHLTGTGAIYAGNIPSFTGDMDMLFNAASGPILTVTLDELPDQNIAMHLTPSTQDDLVIGYSGSGSLTIRDGIEISSNSARIGYLSGSSGTVTVDGSESTWNVGDYLFVGSAGNYLGTCGDGTVTISNGGDLYTNAASVGRRSYWIQPPTGRVILDGQDSTWHTENLVVYNCGEVEITDVALLCVADELRFYLDGGHIDISTGGMLALTGEADESLDDFLALISGSKAINYWNNIYDDWSDITEGMAGLDYTLEYVDDSQSDLFGYTVLTVLTAPKPVAGDADRDGDVDEADAAVLAVNWQMDSGASWYDGDFNNDGAVNDIDATLLATNWQMPGDDSTSIPEPSTLVGLLGLCLAGLFGWGRHK